MTITAVLPKALLVRGQDENLPSKQHEHRQNQEQLQGRACAPILPQKPAPERQLPHPTLRMQVTKHSGELMALKQSSLGEMVYPPCT